MLKFQIITLFPEIAASIANLGLLGRAVREQFIQVSCINLRDYAINSHGQVDDTPYGGGAGLILRPEPLVAAIEGAKQKDPKARVIHFSPRGRLYTQRKAYSFVADLTAYSKGGFILLASRYEGIDQRIIDMYVDEEISLGDFILMGGDLPAFSFIESITRLLPGVLGNSKSVENESFNCGLLEYPQYTKPGDFGGMKVPDVLLSGNHAKIDKWRKDRAVHDTLAMRPDLIVNHSIEISAPLSIALIHYPVLDKQGDVITSSLTNLDIHDIARSCKTFNLDRYYIVHPIKAMRRLAERVCDHWIDGYGSIYNPNRKDALDTIKVVPDLDDVLLNLEARYGVIPKVVTTSARNNKEAVDYVRMRARLAVSSDPYLILFGTGWGLAHDVLERADYHLAPIEGPANYNHLSVRAAVAIILDRLCSRNGETEGN